MVDEQKKVHKIKCKIYTKIKGKEKLLAPKSNNLYKHAVEVGRPYR
jgi:U3 small nucleolar RNA-associated protein 14